MCLDAAEARATLKAVSWFVVHGPHPLLDPDGDALLSARAKLAGATHGEDGITRA